LVVVVVVVVEKGGVAGEEVLLLGGGVGGRILVHRHRNGPSHNPQWQYHTTSFGFRPWLPPEASTYDLIQDTPHHPTHTQHCTVQTAMYMSTFFFFYPWLPPLATYMSVFFFCKPE
jgi:hypothetical protein